MLSGSLIVLIIALVFLIVSFVLALVTNAMLNPQLWALWAIAIYFIVGGLVGVRPG
jgi:hypothetical protein